MKKILALTLALCMILSLAACGAKEETPSAPTASSAASSAAASQQTETVNKDDYFITVLTGPTSGIYFPIGGAFATALGNYGYATSSTATGASAENINAILTGQGELAVAMSDSVLQAYEGTGAYEGVEPASNLKMLMSLWPNYVQLVTTADSGIKTFEDLKGKRVGVGAPNSGVELNARMIFEAHGMTYDDCKVDYLSYGEAISQMQNGLCDAAFVTSGLGNATILELGVNKEIYIVPIEGQALQNLIDKYPCYSEGVIPKDTYDTESDTTTATVMNIMLVNDELPDAVVYDLMNGINQEVATIQSSHNTAAANIIPENYLRATPIPLHPGAEQWYKDNGFLN